MQENFHLAIARTKNKIQKYLLKSKMPNNYIQYLMWMSYDQALVTILNCILLAYLIHLPFSPNFSLSLTTNFYHLIHYIVRDHDWLRLFLLSLVIILIFILYGKSVARFIKKGNVIKRYEYEKRQFVLKLFLNVAAALITPCYLIINVTQNRPKIFIYLAVLLFLCLIVWAFQLLSIGISTIYSLQRKKSLKILLISWYPFKTNVKQYDWLFNSTRLDREYDRDFISRPIITLSKFLYLAIILIFAVGGNYFLLQKPSNSVFNLRAIGLSNAKVYNSSILYFDKSLGIKPQDANICLLKGKTLKKYGDAFIKLAKYPEAQRSYQEAIKSFDRAIKIDSTLIDSYLELAALHAKLNNYQEAELVISKLIDNYPKYLLVYSLAARYSLARGDSIGYNKAIDYLNQGSKVSDPNKNDREKKHFDETCYLVKFYKGIDVKARSDAWTEGVLNLKEDRLVYTPKCLLIRDSDKSIAYMDVEDVYSHKIKENGSEEKGFVIEIKKNKTEFFRHIGLIVTNPTHFDNINIFFDKVKKLKKNNFKRLYKWLWD